MTTTQNRPPLAERKAEAVKQRKAGISPTRIARELGFKDAAAVDRVVAETLAKDSPADSALSWHALELARLDDMVERLTTNMNNGVRGAERDLLRVLDYRIRLQSARDRGPGNMYAAVQKSIADLTLADADAASAQSALDMATMIDVAMSVGTADDQRRAINGMATMRNLLRDIGASPGARDELDGIVSSGSGARNPAPEEAPVDNPGETVEKGGELLSFQAAAAQRLAGGA